MLEAGYKHNVIPGTAAALVDCRFLPGHEERALETIRELAGPGVDVETVHRDVALETPFEGDLVDAMVAALHAEDPGPPCCRTACPAAPTTRPSAGSGIGGYGFAPLRLPADLDFAGMFHGVDERVPVDALRFGVRTLGRFLRTC